MSIGYWETEAALPVVVVVVYCLKVLLAQADPNLLQGRHLLHHHKTG